jgi:hypothetical protein
MWRFRRKTRYLELILRNLGKDAKGKRGGNAASVFGERD